MSRYTYLSLILSLSIFWACNGDHNTKGETEKEIPQVSQTDTARLQAPPSREPYEFEEKTWVLTSFVLEGVDRPILDEAELTISFKNDQLYGFAGCNQYSANYTVDPGSKALQIKETKKGGKSCSQVMTQEIRYLDLLETVHSYEQRNILLYLNADKGKLGYRLKEM